MLYDSSCRRYSVFISSRMEELSMERRAVYHALYRAGQIPLLFEIEPPQKDKEKIDALVDRAHFFLGIYYMTFGPRSPELYKLYPVEYELLRFYTRFLQTNSPEPQDLSTVDRAQIDAAMADSNWVSSLQTILYRPPIAKKLNILTERVVARLAIAQQRTKLFRRVSETENIMVSDQLENFLREFDPENFSGTTVKPPGGSPFIHESRYPPAHVDLFTKALKWAKQLPSLVDSSPAAKDPGIRDTERSQPEKRVRCIVEEPPTEAVGLLYGILEIFFSLGLNIEALWGVVPTASDGKARLWLQADAQIFHVDYETKALEALIEDKIWYLDRGKNFTKDAGAPRASHNEGISLRELNTLEIRLEPENSTRIYEPDFNDDTVVLRISAANIPGMNMSIAHLIAHLKGNIKLFCSGAFAPNDPSRAVPLRAPIFGRPDILVAFDPPKEPDIESTSYVEALIYEISSIFGVEQVTQASKEFAHQHVEEVKRNEGRALS